MVLSVLRGKYRGMRKGSDGGDEGGDSLGAVMARERHLELRHT